MIEAMDERTWRRLVVGIWILSLGLRIRLGPDGDLVVAAAAMIPVWRAGRLQRFTWTFAAFAALAALQVVLPRASLPLQLSLPRWADAFLGSSELRWSLAPWETLRWLGLFAGAALWASIFGQELHARRAQMAGLRWLAGAWALALIAGYRPANANHAAILLAAAMPEAALRLREGSIAAAAVVALAVAALILLGSWAGALLALAGILWGVTYRREHTRGSGFWLILSTAAVAAAVVALAASWWLGGNALQGLQDRWAFWHDAVRVCRDALPWGFGFGAFRWVFPPYAHSIPAPAVRALFPESGYLWLVCAGGVPAVAIAAVSAFKLRRNEGAAAAAARVATLLILIHALIDVPWWWGPVFWTLPLLLACGWRGAAGRNRTPAATT